MGNRIKNVTMPNPQEIAQNYVNSLKRPLGVRVRQEDQEVQRERAMIVKNSTPMELGNLRHPLDIPLPKLRGRNRSTETKESSTGR